MEKTELRNSGIYVSGLSLGTWAFAGAKAKVWGEGDDQAAIDTLHCALANGINLIDTAEKYGDGKSEEVVGEALKGRRSEAVLATKVYTDALHYDDVIAHCEASLKRLQTDYIDLYQIHWPTKDIPMEETFHAFEDLKKAGKIRMASICNAGETCVKEVSNYEVAMNQLPYSLLWRVAEKKIIPSGVEAGVPLWAYSPLAQGLLTGKFRKIEDVPMGRRETRFYSGAWKQGLHNDTGFEAEIFAFLDWMCDLCEKNGVAPAEVAMNFLKRRPFVKSVLVGARSVAQMEQNVASYEKVVSADLMEEIEKKSDELKAVMGENADLWRDENGGRFY